MIVPDKTLNELLDSILFWWDKHQYDVTGEHGDWNVYDNEPEFVTKTKELKEALR